MNVDISGLRQHAAEVQGIFKLNMTYPIQGSEEPERCLEVRVKQSASCYYAAIDARGKLVSHL